jgi:hypothetical protein
MRWGWGRWLRSWVGLRSAAPNGQQLNAGGQPVFFAVPGAVAPGPLPAVSSPTTPPAEPKRGRVFHIRPTPCQRDGSRCGPTRPEPPQQ